MLMNNNVREICNCVYTPIMKLLSEERGQIVDRKPPENLGFPAHFELNSFLLN